MIPEESIVKSCGRSAPFPPSFTRKMSDSVVALPAYVISHQPVM
jgi:hypothetical protein